MTIRKCPEDEKGKSNIFKLTDDYDCGKMKIWYGPEDWVCPKPKSDHWLKVWSRFLDSVSRLPESCWMYHISRAVWVVRVLYNHFSEDELTQLAKFEKKVNIFKIDSEEWM